MTRAAVTQRATAAEVQPAAAGWPAYLHLDVARTVRGCRLVKCTHRGPLNVQRPFYPEGGEVPHIYLLHPPGGLVSGDRLEVEVNVGASSHALLTMPGAARLYRARNATQLQEQVACLRVASGGSVEWLPGENIYYPGAVARATTRVELARGGRLLGWEINAIGLPACRHAFTHGCITQRFEIMHAGKCVLIDTLRVDAASDGMLNGAAGLGGHCVSALLVAGPFDENACAEQQVEQLRSECSAAGRALGVTRLDGFIVARYLGDCSWQARQLFVRCWSLLRPALLERGACAPRIWAT